MRSIVLVALMAVAGCKGKTVTTASAELSASPASLDFGRVALRESLAMTLELTNGGRAASNELALQVEGPFTIAPASVTVAGGSTERLTITFSPTSEGVASGALHLTGLADLPLVGEGLAACTSADPCQAASFDFTVRACVNSPRVDGSACTAPCLSGPGSCRGGYCTGAQLTSCTDTDACTIDACTSTGECVHPPLDCPVTDPCLATYCDPVSGCASQPVTDGVPCGPATCESALICLNGRCEERVRPNAASVCRYTSIAAGSLHTCAVTVGREVRCWGGNSVDQQGRGFPSAATLPGLAEGISGVKSVAVPVSSTTWAALDTGEVTQLTDGGRLPLNVSALAAGIQGQVCGLESGAVRCAPPDAGAVLTLALDALDLSMSSDQLCVVFLDGGVKCGIPPTLAVVPLPGAASAVAAGERQTGCAQIGSAGYCWGEVVDGGPAFPWSSGVQALTVSRRSLLAVSQACAATSTGLRCAGSDRFISLEPGAVLSRPAKQLSLGMLHGCALLDDGHVECWGDNSNGQLGERSSQPVGVKELPSRASWLGRFVDDVLFAADGGPVQSLATFRIEADPDAGGQRGIGLLVDVGGMIADYDVGCPCARDGGMQTYCWAPGSLPVADATACTWTSRSGLCTSLADGTVRCASDLDGGWSAGAPVRTLAGGFGVCAVRTDGVVRCQGLAQPTVPEALADVKDLCLARDEAVGGCALLNSGVLQCWGDWVQSAAPRQPSGAWPLVRQISCGAAHFCALSGGNIVQCWGHNESGQLGLDGPASAQAVSVPMPEQVTSIAAGSFHTCALLRSGRVLCWGTNSRGQLGSPVKVSSPRPVPVTQ